MSGGCSEDDGGTRHHQELHSAGAAGGRAGAGLHHHLLLSTRQHAGRRRAADKNHRGLRSSWCWEDTAVVFYFEITFVQLVITLLNVTMRVVHSLVVMTAISDSYTAL